jgi:hypothetical protein
MTTPPLVSTCNFLHANSLEAPPPILPYPALHLISFLLVLFFCCRPAVIAHVLCSYSRIGMHIAQPCMYALHSCPQVGRAPSNLRSLSGKLYMKWNLLDDASNGNYFPVRISDKKVIDLRKIQINITKRGKLLMYRWLSRLFHQLTFTFFSFH